MFWFDIGLIVFNLRTSILKILKEKLLTFSTYMQSMMKIMFKNQIYEKFNKHEKFIWCTTRCEKHPLSLLSVCTMFIPSSLSTDRYAMFTRKIVSVGAFLQSHTCVSSQVLASLCYVVPFLHGLILEAKLISEMHKLGNGHIYC